MCPEVDIRTRGLRDGTEDKSELVPQTLRKVGTDLKCEELVRRTGTESNTEDRRDPVTEYRGPRRVSYPGPSTRGAHKEDTSVLDAVVNRIHNRLVSRNVGPKVVSFRESRIT